VIRNKDITNIEVTDFNKYCMKIMKLEKTWITKLPMFVRKIKLTNFRELFRGIKSRVIIIENEGEKSDFIIGPITKISRDAVSIHYFNGVGEWEEVMEYRYSNITTVKFLDKYSSTHAKYLKWA
jgi:hypothetical protein